MTNTLITDDEAMQAMHWARDWVNGPSKVRHAMLAQLRHAPSYMLALVLLCIDHESGDAAIVKRNTDSICRMLTNPDLKFTDEPL